MDANKASECSGTYSDLDEFLCEYVDGTMDPAVRRSFEEYLRSDPDLIGHVEKLRQTRLLLCHYGCQLHAPAGLQVRLRQRLGGEVIRTEVPQLSLLAERVGSTVALSSAMLLMMMMGVFVGQVVFDEVPAPNVASRASVERFVQPLPAGPVDADLFAPATKLSMFMSFPASDLPALETGRILPATTDSGRFDWGGNLENLGLVP